ncbi:MAG: apolipoprotein N-acyltransferase [Bacteroidetes bacterium]|nr:apolipoprotein N-acyltransferase [Bacteroidota bacterium]
MNIQSVITKYKLLLLSILAGVLLFISWPPNGITPLVFVAFIPILIIDQALLNRDRANSVLYFFYFIFLSFFIWNVLSTYWIAYSSITAAVTAILLNSLFMSIPWIFMHYARKKLPGKTSNFLIVFLWIGFEYLHLNWELSWPWLQLGNVFSTTTSWVQWYEYTGVLGGTAWVLLSNILIYNLLTLLKNHSSKVSQKTTSISLAVAVFLVPVLLSLSISNNYKEESSPVEVVIVQHGIDSYNQVGSMEDVINRMNQMTKLAGGKITNNTKFVISPEASIPITVWKNFPEKNTGVVLLRIFSQINNNVAWVSGGFVKRLYYAGEKAPYTAKKHEVDGEHIDLFNSAIMVQGYENIQFYYKSKLVPGSEKVPFYRYAKFLSPVVEKFGGFGGSYGFQRNRSVFTTKDSIKVAPIICYESVFGEYVADYVKNGAELLFILTNDGWWGNTSGHKQHFNYARLRAIETRRSIARSASTGISGFIDQKGNIIDSLGWMESGAIIQSINASNKITFYVRNGDYLGKLSIFISILIVLYVLTQKIIRR